MTNVAQTRNAQTTTRNAQTTTRNARPDFTKVNEFRDQYRVECEHNPTCPIKTACSSFGVGKVNESTGEKVYPVTTIRAEKELSPSQQEYIKANYGPDAMIKAGACVRQAMWKDPKFAEEMKTRFNMDPPPPRNTNNVGKASNVNAHTNVAKASNANAHTNAGKASNANNANNANNATKANVGKAKKTTMKNVAPAAGGRS